MRKSKAFATASIDLDAKFDRLIELSTKWTNPHNWEMIHYAATERRRDLEIADNMRDLAAMFGEKHGELPLVKMAYGNVDDRTRVLTAATAELQEHFDLVCELIPEHLGDAPIIDVADPAEPAQTKELVACMQKLLGKAEAARRDNSQGDQAACDSLPRKARAPIKRDNISERILAMLSEDNERLSWTVRQWAEQLGCAPATVTNTEAWSKIQAERATNYADLSERNPEAKFDRRRKRRPS